MSVSAHPQEDGSAARGWFRTTVPHHVFEWAVIFGDLALLTLGVWMTGASSVSAPWVLLAWTALVAAAGLIPVQTEQGLSLGLDLPLVLGAGLVFGPLVAGIVAFVGVLDVREVHRDVSLGRALFNRSQVSISAMAGALVFPLAGGHLGTWPWAAFAGLAAVAVDAAVNYVLVGTYWSLKDDRPLASVVSEMRLGSLRTFLPTYICFGFLSVFVGEAYVQWGLAGVVACVAPVALAREAFLHRHLLDRTDSALRSEIKSKEDSLRTASNLMAQERRDERRVIAAELHDEVLPPLFKVHLMGQVLKQDLATGQLLALDDDLPGLLEATEVAQSAIRSLLGDLRQSPLGPGGLDPTLRLLSRELESAGAPHIHLDLAPIAASDLSQLLCYQVAREALNNVARHSEATGAWVRIRCDDEAIRLVVEDDGVGFNPVDVDETSHFGLQLVLERVDACGGKAVVDSEVGLGTRVAAVIPRHL